MAVRERKLKQPDSGSEVQKRLLDANSQFRQEVGTKSKELYNSKSNPNISEQIPQKNEAFLNKIKTLTMESASNMRFLEMTLSKNKNDPHPLPDRPGPREFQNREQANQGKADQKSSNQRVTQSSPNAGSFFFKDTEKAKKANELEERLGL